MQSSSQDDLKAVVKSQSKIRIRKFNPEDDDDLNEIEEEDLNALNQEGYHSEDEMEEFLAQDIIDTRMDFNKMETDTKQKFIMHK